MVGVVSPGCEMRAQDNSGCHCPDTGLIIRTLHTPHTSSITADNIQISIDKSNIDISTLIHRHSGNHQIYLEYEDKDRP